PLYSLIHSFLRLLYISLSFSFFFYCSLDHRLLHSFPTRRSSDLYIFCTFYHYFNMGEVIDLGNYLIYDFKCYYFYIFILEICKRSEEHTSELQSRENLVCRLLLEKKKNKKQKIEYLK